MFSKIIMVMIMCVLALASIGNAAMVAQWEMDDINDTSIEDVSNDTLTNNSRLVGGQAVVEAGGYKLANKSAEISFTGNDSFTVWARIKTNDWDAYKRIIANDSDADGGWFLRTTNDAPARQLQFGVGNGGGNFFSGLLVNPGDWHNVAAVYDGVNNTVMVYLDGAIATSGSTILLPTNAGQDTMVLANNSGGEDFIVDEIRLYDEKLTVAQLDDISRGLVALWEMDDVNDTSTEDVSNDTLTKDDYLSVGEMNLPAGEYTRANKSNEITLTGDDSFTVWARIKTNDWSANKRIIANDSDADGGWFLRTTNDAPAMQLHFGVGGGNSFFSGLLVNPGDWRNVAAVYDGVNDTVMVYLDGVTATSGSDIVLSANAGQTTFVIGNNTGGENFQIDEVRLYDKKLTVKELDHIANTGGPLVAQWTFIDTNDWSTEDATNDVFTLHNGATPSTSLISGDNESGVLQLFGDDYVQIPRSAELTFQHYGGDDDSFTIWARIRKDDWHNVTRPIFNNQNATGGIQFRVNNDPPAQSLRCTSGSGSNFISNLVVNNLDWYNVAMIYEGGDANMCTLYLKQGDNAAFTQSALSFDLGDAGAVSYLIGSMSSLGTLYMEELRVYNTALSVAELDVIEYYIPSFVCGDLGTVYLQPDLNKDCYVDLLDFVLFADNWVKCTDPENSDCDQHWK